ILRAETPFTAEMLKQVKEQAPWLLQPARHEMSEDFRIYSDRWGKGGPGSVGESTREEDIPRGMASTLRGATHPSLHSVDIRRGADSVRVLAHEIGHVASYKYNLSPKASEAMADLLGGDPNWANQLG